MRCSACCRQRRWPNGAPRDSAAGRAGAAAGSAAAGRASGRVRPPVGRDRPLPRSATVSVLIRDGECFDEDRGMDEAVSLLKNTIPHLPSPFPTTPITK